MCARRLEKLRLSYIDRLLPEHIESSFCAENSTIRMVKSMGANILSYYITVILTLRLLMSYIYGAPILDVSRSHTTTQHSR